MSRERSTEESVAISPEQGGTWSVLVDEQAAVDVLATEELVHREGEFTSIISLAIDAGAGRLRARLTPAEARTIATRLTDLAATAEDRDRDRDTTD